MNGKQLELNGKAILVTGAAGFIGAHLVRRLLKENKDSLIIGLDNMSDYYDVGLKEARLWEIKSAGAERGRSGQWVFCKGSVSDRNCLKQVFEDYDIDLVVHLAAQPGVRYSVDHPDIYVQSNVIGFYEILEACRYHPVEHLVYASSSSVYGGNTKVPFAEADKADLPVSLYAATKKSNEMFAHAYSELYGIPVTGLRFFTAYGPMGRPDMFYYSASDKLIAGEKLPIYNYGNCKRDYTYIDDIVEGVFCVMKRDHPPCEIYNIGGGAPVGLMEFICILHEELIREGLLSPDHDLNAQLEFMDMQPGDVEVTCADCSSLERDFGCRPEVGIREGLRSFVQWYSSYHRS